MDDGFPVGAHVIVEHPTVLADAEERTAAVTCATILSSFDQAHNVLPPGRLPVRQLRQYRDQVVQGMVVRPLSAPNRPLPCAGARCPLTSYRICDALCTSHAMLCANVPQRAHWRVHKRTIEV